MSDIVRVETSERGGVVVAQVIGELDVAGASSMGREIANAVPTSAIGLVVDFTRLDFIDSSGVAMLFMLARRLSSRRQQLRVVAPEDSPVVRVLQIVDFHRAAPLDSDLEQALAAVAEDS